MLRNWNETSESTLGLNFLHFPSTEENRLQIKTAINTAALEVEGIIEMLVRRESEFREVTVSQGKFNQSYDGQKLIYKNKTKQKPMDDVL